MHTVFNLMAPPHPPALMSFSQPGLSDVWILGWLGWLGLLGWVGWVGLVGSVGFVGLLLDCLVGLDRLVGLVGWNPSKSAEASGLSAFKVFHKFQSI